MRVEARRERMVLIIGPMTTSGEPGPNLHAAANAAADLLIAGFYPFVPHAAWVLHAIRPDVPVSLWKAWDFAVLERCGSVLRLPGESEGADAEAWRAAELGIPVFADVDALVKEMLHREFVR